MVLSPLRLIPSGEGIPVVVSFVELSCCFADRHLRYAFLIVARQIRRISVSMENESNGAVKGLIFFRKDMEDAEIRGSNLT